MINLCLMNCMFIGQYLDFTNEKYQFHNSQSIFTVVIVNVSETHQSSLWFNERPVDPVHLVVESAGVTQVMTRPVPPPQRSGHRPAVHTLSTLRELIEQL